MQHPKGKKAGLILCNFILVVSMICVVVIYARTSTRQKNMLRRDTFCNTVEALKQVSQNYLITEKGYADDWAAYIEACHMTAEEALEYIRTTNAQDDRSAHLVNMQDLSARSTYLRKDNPWVHCYEEMGKLGTADSNSFLAKMQQIFDEDQDRLFVLGKYRVGESQKTVVSVGTRVMIREDDGTDQPYLLLRLIPVEYMQKSWIFPTEYTDAEISLIVRDGGYVVQSPSMRSKNFLEFIRGYNFSDDYTKMDVLADKLQTDDKGLLEYKDSKGQDCYFYYSFMGDDTDLAILGYIPVDEIQTEAIDWISVSLISGTILLLMVIDGAYILSINRRLRRAIRMEEKASMAKTQFLSSMSHDIRTPMNAVIGMTEIARHHLDDPDFVKECLDKVAVAGNHLLTLVNDILDISKVESGKMTLNPVTFSVLDAAEEMEEMVRQAAADKDITFTMNVHDISHEMVVGDTLRLQQIVINLLTNAVKYTESGGHVQFEVSEYQVETENCTGLRFVVADDGMGMSEEFQKNMYSSFSRATDSRINTIQGSGLGLAIAKQMVELMNGTIRCTSAPGEGTTFEIQVELKIDKTGKNHSASAGIAEDQNEFAGMNVLVVEDNELNWEIVQMMLEEYGVITEWAQNGQICLDTLKKNGAEKYDLVLMDVQMPVLDGRETTRCMRSSDDPAMRGIPVVAMTADAFAEDVYACLEAGMDGHISKPIEIKRVVEILKKIKNKTLR